MQASNRNARHLCRLVQDVLSSSNSNAAAAHLNLLQSNDSNGGFGTEVSNPVEQGAAVWPLLVHIPGQAQHLQVLAAHQSCCFTVKGVSAAEFVMSLRCANILR